jgi:hypothetical protein
LSICGGTFWKTDTWYTGMRWKDYIDGMQGDSLAKEVEMLKGKWISLWTEPKFQPEYSYC